MGMEDALFHIVLFHRYAEVYYYALLISSASAQETEQLLRLVVQLSCVTTMVVFALIFLSLNKSTYDTPTIDTTTSSIFEHFFCLVTDACACLIRHWVDAASLPPPSFLFSRRQFFGKQAGQLWIRFWRKYLREARREARLSWRPGCRRWRRR